MIWYSLTEDHRITKTKMLRKNCQSLPGRHPSSRESSSFSKETFFQVQMLLFLTFKITYSFKYHLRSLMHQKPLFRLLQIPVLTLDVTTDFDVTLKMQQITNNWDRVILQTGASLPVSNLGNHYYNPGQVYVIDAGRYLDLGIKIQIQIVGDRV